MYMPKGWNEKLFEYAEKVIIKCNSCEKEIDIKKAGEYGCISDVFSDCQKLHFLCKNCYTPIQEFIIDFVKKNKTDKTTQE